MISNSREDVISNSRFVFWIIITLLVSAVVVTLIFAQIVRNKVLADADRTDLDMRAVAWASIAFACSHEGRFPIDEQELYSMEPLPETIDCVPAAGENWPVARQDAMRGEPAPALVEAFDRLDIVFSSDGALAPLVSEDGSPTLIDPPTKDTIREWLFTFSTRESQLRTGG